MLLNSWVPWLHEGTSNRSLENAVQKTVQSLLVR